MGVLRWLGLEFKMTTAANKKSLLRDKTKTGWAAFDLQQRRKRDGLEPSIVVEREPFPSLLRSSAPKINSQLKKPFVSVVEQRDDYPDLIFIKNDDDKIRDKDIAGDDEQIQVGYFSSKEGEGKALFSNGGKGELSVSDKLQKSYPWADMSLIQDILVGVDGNSNEAASLLKVMELSSDGNVEHENASRSIDEKNTLSTSGCDTLEKVDYDSHQSKVYTNKQEDKSFFDVDGCISEMLLFNGAESSKVTMDAMSGKSDSIPVEPEWEEDDVYLVHRRDALKVMRSASHHSKASNDAYLRGDHLLAQHHSSKAREAWKVAERLNAQAAKEILSTRNSKNDTWTLDLHGLHSAEAVEALQEHLLKIEFQTHSSSHNRSNSIYAIPSSLLLDSSNFNEGVKGREVPSPSQKSTTLQVITGKGNHSRGQAALPAAVRSFLIENGYRFDESRPGVIAVRPKFRRW